MKAEAMMNGTTRRALIAGLFKGLRRDIVTQHLGSALRQAGKSPKVSSFDEKHPSSLELHPRRSI
jgi:hypothetical protein